MGCSFIGNLHFFNVPHRVCAGMGGGGVGGGLPSFLNGQHRENLIIVTEQMQ